MITWEAKRKMFKFHADITSVDSAKRKGFVYNKEIKSWETPFWEIAAKLCFNENDRNEIQIDLLNQKRKYLESFMLDSWFEPRCPEGLEFLPFQRYGIYYILKNDRVLLADPMGLGKTVQVIGALNELHARDKMGRVLVVCPARLKLVWKDHLLEWATFKVDVGIATTSSLPTNQIVICSYGSLSKLIEQTRKVNWGVITVDESHFAKNKDAIRTQALVGKWSPRITPLKADKIICLSGTPAVSRPIELWTIAKWLCPEGFPLHEEYGKLYCGGFLDNSRWNFKGHSKLDELRVMLRSSIMIRRNKLDALPFLPKVRRQVIRIEPDLKTRNIIKREGEQLHSLGVKSSDLESYNYESIVKLIKTVRVKIETYSKDRLEAALSKIPAVIEQLEDCLEYEHKVICFCHHKEVANQIYEYFKHFAIISHSDINDKILDTTEKEFQTNDKVRLLVGTIGTIGVGLTLTKAQHCLFAETPATPGEEDQGTDRLNRIGQLGSVLVQHIVIDGTIDSYLIKLIVAKQNVLKQIME